MPLWLVIVALLLWAVIAPYLLFAGWAWLDDLREEREWRRG